MEIFDLDNDGINRKKHEKTAHEISLTLGNISRSSTKKID